MELIYIAITYPQSVVSMKKAFLTNTEGRVIQVTNVQKVSIQESSVNVVKQCGDPPCGVRMKWVKDFFIFNVKVSNAGGFSSLNSSGEIHNSISHKNSYSMSGGGLKIESGGNVKIFNLDLIENFGGKGGGFYCSANVQMTGGRISNNRALENGIGHCYLRDYRISFQDVKVDVNNHPSTTNCPGLI